MTAKETWEVGGAIIIAFGGSGALLIALSRWFGKCLADKLLESERAEHATKLAGITAGYGRELEVLKADHQKVLEAWRTEKSKALKVYHKR